METTSSLFTRIREHIAANELTDALNLLRALLQNTPELNDVLQQSGRLASIRQQVRNGIVSYEDATLTENQIRFGMLELLTEIETSETGGTHFPAVLSVVEETSNRPELKAELQRAISIINSKNVVSGTISAGGDVHIGDIIYQNGGNTDDTPTHDFNKQLTRSLVEAMQPYHEKAQKLCSNYSWLEHPSNLRKVQQFVFRNFVGEIGKQLRRLVNIGTDETMPYPQKAKHYRQRCLEIAKRTLDLLNFTLLSQWWKVVKNAPRKLNDEQTKVLSNFFNKDLEHPLHQQFTQLRLLRDLFIQHNLSLPFQELAQMDTALTPNGSIHQACQKLEQLAPNGKASETEAQLAEIMRHFAFLTRYKMVSIKRIRYRQIRDAQPDYLHRYVALGMDFKYSEDTEKGNWISVGEQAPAVMLFAGNDYQKGINLFPFVIDLNALTFEQGAKICFFNAKDLTNAQLLEYRFLGDNSIEPIKREGILDAGVDLSELMMDEEKLKIYNLDCVVDTFLAAQAAILPKGDDFFDNL